MFGAKLAELFLPHPIPHRRRGDKWRLGWNWL